VLAFAGCASPGPYLPQDTTKNTLETSEHFVVLDQAVQYSVTCTGVAQQRLADGRLSVAANVKNRENRRIEVQIRCVFKDESRFSTGDETPWETLILSENATQTVRFASMSHLAHHYTFTVRQAKSAGEFMPRR
jgi:succinylarginine dihydrolase